jgi:ABC-type uncharacterized transport system YnjBCD permease subunit
MLHWAVSWTTDEIIDFVFLLTATVVVVAVPVVYGAYANLRDPLARAMLAGTASTGFAFAAAVVVQIAVHAGWSPDPSVFHWVARLLYITVAIGKAALLLALLKVLREMGFRKHHYRRRGIVK